MSRNAVVQHHLSIPSRRFLLSVHSCEGEEHQRPCSQYEYKSYNCIT